MARMLELYSVFVGCMRFSLKTASTLKVVKDEMSTDLKNSDLKKLARMQLIKMRKWTVSRTNLVGSTGSAPCFSMGNQALSCVFLDETKVEEAKERIHNTMFPVDNTQTIVEQEQEEKQEKQSE